MLDCGCSEDGKSLCFKHKLRTIQWSPSATPSRRSPVPPRTPDNSWERGVVKDKRGMPLLDKNLEPIGQAELANNRRQIEDGLRALKNTPPTPAT